MFLNELSEPQLLVVYPGRFQPFHKGHHAVFEWLSGKFGRNNVIIATSNKVEPPRSPFSFAEKAYFMQLTGVPADRIVQATSPYNISNVLSGGQVTVQDPNNTVVVFAISEKDMEDDPRFGPNSFTKKDGSPAYLQKLINIKQTENMTQHAYIMTVPTFDFNVLGQPMCSGTELREMYTNADTKTRQAIIKDLFGVYTPEAEKIMNTHLPSPADAEPVATPALAKTAKLKTVRKPGALGEDAKHLDPARIGLLTKAKRAHPLAHSDEEAMALYIYDKEQRDVDDVEHGEHNLESKIQKLEHLLQQVKADVHDLASNQNVAEGLSEARNSLFTFVKQQFPNWPDYVLKDFLYQQAKGIRDQAELDDFLKRNKQDFGNCKWTLTKLPITFDIFTPKTQRMLASREGGSSNPFQVPRDAERHAQQSQMIQQKGVSAEPIIVAKLSNGYDLIEGWHRTIQHLKAFPQGYTGPAWVCTGATYKSESVEQGVAEAFDNPYKTKTEKSDYGDVDMLAKLPDGTNLSIMFNNQGDDEWQVEFYRNNSQEVTGEGDAQRVFATVLASMQKFIKKYKPWRLTFSATKLLDPSTYYEPDQPVPNPESRAKLYNRLVQRYATAWGYEEYAEDHGDQITYELTRLKPGMAEGATKIHSDKEPKLTGVSFQQLDSLCESAGSDYVKFDRAIKKNLVLPAWTNTLELYGVYARKLNEVKSKTLAEGTQSDIEQQLFDQLSQRALGNIDSASVGDRVSLLHLATLNIPGHKVVAKLSGFLTPKQIVKIVNTGRFQQLEFADGSRYPEKDGGDIFQQAQTWNMTKLFPSADAASKAFMFYMLEGQKLSDVLDFQTNVEQGVAEGWNPEDSGENDLFAAYDKILIDLCNRIVKHQKQNSDRYGLVAAAVVDPDHIVVYGINHKLASGKRVHAERAAMANYIKRHGAIPKNSVVITTLSPCTDDMPDRKGPSCTELLNDSPITRVYAGYRDPSQTHLSHDNFDVVYTQNSKIESVCKQIADRFLKESAYTDPANYRSEGVVEGGGVGVVKGGRNPRYSTATMGDQNAVNSNTLGKEMQAFGLTGRKNPGQANHQKNVSRNVSKGIYEQLQAKLEFMLQNYFK
jgi:cytidyltransferase-like protein